MTIHTSIGGIETELIDYSKLTKPVTIAEIDAIVTDCLDLLDRRVYHWESEARGESFVYTVHKNGALMGRFKVWRRDDTPSPVRYGVYQYSDTLELEREWKKNVYGMLYIEIARRVEARDAVPTEPATMQALEATATTPTSFMPSRGFWRKGKPDGLVNLQAVNPTRARKAEPTKPSKSEPLDKWFEYYHNCKNGRIKYTLKDLASDVSLTYGYIRQEHAKYQGEHGKQNT